MKKRLITGIIISIATLSLLPTATFAHVVVTPAKASIGQHLTFNVSVANEKDVDVTALKLTIPAGLDDVSPTTKDGWTIDTTKTGDAVTEISWTNGKIPVGQRQDFSFGAQAPAKAGDIDWKAYQTYADGTVVKWDQAPTNSDTEGENVGPYSVTTVSDDLTTPVVSTQTPTTSLTLVLSIVAVILSVASLFIRRRK